MENKFQKGFFWIFLNGTWFLLAGTLVFSLKLIVFACFINVSMEIFWYLCSFFTSIYSDFVFHLVYYFL